MDKKDRVISSGSFAVRRYYRLVPACTILLALFLGIVPSVALGGDQDDLGRALAAVDRAETIDELIKQAESATYNTVFVRGGIWYAAAFLSWGPGFGSDVTIQRRVIKAVVFATLLELAGRGKLSNWPKGEGLFALGPRSIRALNGQGFGTDEAYKALLERLPEIRSDWRGYYRYLRLAVNANGVSFVLERSDTPWGSLTKEGRVAQKPLGPEARRKQLPVEGLSFSFPLSAMNDLIIAGKAFLCLELSLENTPYQQYARIVAGNAFYDASGAAGADLASAATFPLQRAIEWLRQNPIQHGKLLTAENLKPRLTSARFFAKKLRIALKDYQDAAGTANRELGYRLYGEWGTAISLFGLQDRQASIHFRRVAKLVETNSPEQLAYRYMLSALYEFLGPYEILGSSQAEKSLVSKINSWRNETISTLERYKLNQDLERVLFMIDRYDLAAKLLMREIGRARKQTGGSFRQIERDYLHELGATMSDAFGDLSWMVDDDGVEKARTNNVREFAPTAIDELFPGARGKSRYGMASAEEDRATCVELYSPSVSDPGLRLLVATAAGSSGKINPLPTTTVDGFERWVRQELSEMPPNVKPLLKLAWLEWFFVPFAPLSSAQVQVEAWRYLPTSRSVLTSESNIQGELNRAGRSLEKNTGRVWTTFREVHQFLLTNYN